MPHERILCAMSGGVDSSTAAALLVEAGHAVVGVTLHLSDTPPGKRTGRCCAAEDVEDARAVARHLNIPHYVLDRRELFRQAVIDRFVDEYAAGRTPTPCTRCNDEVKIAPLVGLALRLGLDALATGHYARVEASDGHPVLLRAADLGKDQSYFLFPAGPDVLSRLRLPLGALQKSEVRAVARRLGLPVAEKPESMEVCFAADGAAAYVEDARPDLPGGEVVDEAGRLLGTHRGVHRFTVGQRKGLPSRGGERLYAIALDASKGRVVAGPEESLYQTALRAEDVRWHAPPPARFVADVQIRHRAEAAPAEITTQPDGTAVVCFETPQRAIAPGQAAVFYRQDRVLGGGWITAALGCLVMLLLPACGPGAGNGWVRGTVHIPECDLEGEYKLHPDFFVAELFDSDHTSSLAIRIQHGGDFVEYADGILIGISDRQQILDGLGTAFPIEAPDASSKEGTPPLIRASFSLAGTCEDGPGLTGVGGSITFTQMVDDDDDRIEGSFDIQFADPGGGESTADLQSEFEFHYERGRPAQRYP